MNREEVIWAGGLFEGEGCITVWQRAKYTPQPSAGLTMTDEDAVRRFADAVGFGSVRADKDRGHKPTWTWKATGFPSVQALVALLWPWLGQRRRARAKEVLDLSCGPRGVSVRGRKHFDPQFGGSCGVREP